MKTPLEHAQEAFTKLLCLSTEGHKLETLEKDFHEAMREAREPLEKELAKVNEFRERVTRLKREAIDTANEYREWFDRIKSATEILTIDGKVWIPAEKHQQVVDRARGEALEEAVKECETIKADWMIHNAHHKADAAEYLIDRIRSLKSKAE